MVLTCTHNQCFEQKYETIEIFKQNIYLYSRNISLHYISLLIFIMVVLVNLEKHNYIMLDRNGEIVHVCGSYCCSNITDLMV